MSTDNPRVSQLRAQLQGAHETLEGTMADVTAEQAQWTPPGIAHPIGATYAHVVLSEDGMINGMLKGAAPLAASSWAERNGISEMQPSPDPENPGLSDWSEWARRVEVDLDAARAYAAAVYEASDAYLATLSDADLDKPVDLSAIGAGEATVGYVMGGVMLANTQWHCGEISCLKGLQGVKGYPF